MEVVVSNRIDDIERTYQHRYKDDGKIVQSSEIEKIDKLFIDELKKNLPTNIDKCCQFYKNDDFNYNVRLFTDNHEYLIYVRVPKDENDKGHINPNIFNRKHLAGETWYKHSGLPDDTHENCASILAYFFKLMITCELVELYTDNLLK